MPFITPLALATAADFRLRSYGANAVADCTVSLLDIVTNAPQDTWGSDPLQGWDVPISGPNHVMVRAWSFKKLTGGSTYHKWQKVVIYASAFLDGAFEVIYLQKSPNWDIAVPGGTIGASNPQPEACYYEASVGAVPIGAWGGPNDPRTTVMATSSIGSDGSWTPPTGIQDYQGVQFTAAIGGTLPTGITSGQVYWFGNGKLHYMRIDIANQENTNVPLSVSGGSGNMNVIPVVACFYGQGNLFTTADCQPIRVGTAKRYMTVAWDEDYMSSSARMFPAYNQTDLRPDSSATDISFTGANYCYPNTAPYGMWLNRTGDDPGDPRIGYIDYPSNLTLLKPHDVDYQKFSFWYASGWVDQQMWWESTATGRIVPLDNGPNKAGAIYPELGPPHPDRSQNGGGGHQEGWLTKWGGGSYDNSAGYFDGGSSATMDTSHMPAPWIVPAFKTGHPVWGDIGRAQSQQGSLFLYQRTSTNGGNTYYNFIMGGDQQIRGMGWLIRAYDFTEGFTPDAFPESAYIKFSLDQTADILNAYVTFDETAPNINIGRLYPYQVDPNQPWMLHIMGTAIALQLAKGDRPNWLPYLEAMANYSVGLVNDASPTGGSGFFLSGGHFINWTSGGTPWANLRAMIAGNGNYNFETPPYPTGGFCALDGGGGTDPLFQTNGGFPYSTTSYHAIHLCFLAVLGSLGVVSTNGDDALTAYNSCMTRIFTSPETGIKYGDTSGGGGLWTGARSVDVFAIVPYP